MNNYYQDQPGLWEQEKKEERERAEEEQRQEEITKAWREQRIKETETEEVLKRQIKFGLYLVFGFIILLLLRSCH